MGSGKGTFLANKLLDLPLSATAFSAAATLYVGLFTATPVAGGGGVEVTGGSYVRFSVTNNVANFPASSGGAKSNGTAWTFVTATGAWGTITGIGIFDASTSGNMYYFADLVANKTVGNGDVFSIPAG